MDKEPAHTNSRYDQELQGLRKIMRDMAAHVQQQTADAVTAVINKDERLANEPPQIDHKVDALEREAEILAIRILALRSPLAIDLRMIIAVLKISGDLERIGDYASSIARRAIKISNTDTNVPLTALRAMSNLVQANLDKAINAMMTDNRREAEQVWEADAAVDELYVTLFRELVTYMMEDPRTITSCTHLLFIAKNLERIGDHTTNIAERIFYAVTGKMLPSERPQGGQSRHKESHKTGKKSEIM